MNWLRFLQGERGPRGKRGRRGAPGERGATGETGPIGETGARGETGPRARLFIPIFFAIIAAFVVSLGIYSLVVKHRVEQQNARAVVVATTIWKARACDGNVTIRTTALPGNQSGEANWTEVSLPTGTERTNCVINVDNRDWSEKRYCGVIVHEYGHLLGKPHSRNPNSIMYPVMTNRNIPDRC